MPCRHPPQRFLSNTLINGFGLLRFKTFSVEYVEQRFWSNTLRGFPGPRRPHECASAGSLLRFHPNKISGEPSPPTSYEARKTPRAHAPPPPTGDRLPERFPRQGGRNGGLWGLREHNEGLKNSTKVSKWHPNPIVVFGPRLVETYQGAYSLRVRARCLLSFAKDATHGVLFGPGCLLSLARGLTHGVGPGAG